MNIRLMIATGLALIAVAPNVTLAVEDALKKGERADAKVEKKSEKKDDRLARKCAHEAAKDRHDAEWGRKHPRRDNKWDELCAPPPAPPPPAEEPAPDLPQQPVPPA